MSSISKVGSSEPWYSIRVRSTAISMAYCLRITCGSTKDPARLELKVIGDILVLIEGACVPETSTEHTQASTLTKLARGIKSTKASAWQNRAKPQSRGL
ncbi:hypothetical protein D3C76_1666950 [compost metagenome]